ncbi:MAG: alkaline phosphatase family protein [Desulfocapsa sp.]|nr:alkaline phosphatase family protein [Desulfocapsa sp.]
MPPRLLNKSIVLMIDGFDMEYYRKTDMPVMRKMAREGFFKAGSGIFPSLTNANNISIACACWPDSHGVTTNCYYDHETDSAVFLEHQSFLKAPTIFELAAQLGKKSALLTCKSKTSKILGGAADVVVTAEAPDDEICEKYGAPPPMYSTEINYWLFDIAIDLIENRPDIELIYVHTTDYPMHMWEPEAQESQIHMKKLDDYLAQIAEKGPDFTIALTADHGMNPKKRCWDLSKACSNRGLDLKFAVSPVADRLLKHHRGFGGVSYVHLKKTEDKDKAISIIGSLEGVDSVFDRESAAKRFGLMKSRIGDLVILPDRDTVFGDLPMEVEELATDYRSHGSLYEMDIPLLLFNTKNSPPPEYREINYNLDLTQFLFGGNR